MPQRRFTLSNANISITINTLIMKKKIFSAWILLLSMAAGFTGCKKSNAEKDYPSLFKNTVWTGNFNYTGAVVQPLSIEFSEGGQVTWHELSGDYTGTWKLNNKTLSLNFSVTSGFTADITEDNKFTNIKSVTGSGWTLVDGALNSASDESLDNTSWTAPNLVLNFKPGNKVDMLLGPSGITTYPDVPYVRQGKSIRFAASATYKWFLVKNNSNSCKGANAFTTAPAVYPFDLLKK
jgi:hypothetical protein